MKAGAAAPGVARCSARVRRPPAVALGGRQKLFQLLREVPASVGLRVRDERQRDDDRGHDRPALHVSMNRALGLQVPDVPNRGVVTRIVFPPREAHATRAADTGRAADTAAARYAIRGPVEPNDIADTRAAYLIQHAGALEQM